MRIALVTDYYLPTLGGVQTAVRALAESLRSAGHDVTVFCPLATASTDPGVVGLPVSPVFRPDGYPFAWTPARVRSVLRREFAARGIDVVHTHSEMFAALGGVRAADDLGLPVVHTMHGRIDVYTQHVLPLPGVTTALLARLHGGQVSHAGITVAADSADTATRAARRMWRVMLAQSRASDHVVVPSAHFARRLVDRGVRTPVSVVSNGLEPSVLAAVGPGHVRLLHAGDPLRIVWVGRMSPEKRPEVLVDAAHRFPDGVEVHVYGDGVARSAVRRAARDTPVVLHGAVSHRQVLHAMHDAHVLVSSSSGFDNQPMVMLEAIASGLPVVHTDPDLVEVVPEHGGFCTPTPDADGLVSTIRRLRADPALVTTASRAMIAARSRVEQQTRAIVDVYDRVVDDRRDRERRSPTDR